MLLLSHLGAAICSVIVSSMASSTSGNSIPATEAVQVLVSSLADESPRVRDASMSPLKDIATLNPLWFLTVALLLHVEAVRELGILLVCFKLWHMLYIFWIKRMSILLSSRNSPRLPQPSLFPPRN